MNKLRWTKSEKIVAKRAFGECYQKKCEAVLTKSKERIAILHGLMDAESGKLLTTDELLNRIDQWAK